MAQRVNRGEIRWVRLDPAEGSAANKRRPAVLVSNDTANDSASRLGRGVVTVVPLSTSVETVYRFQVLVLSGDSGLPRDSKAQAEQVRSVSVKRVGGRIGQLNDDQLKALDDALRLHLALH